MLQQRHALSRCCWLTSRADTRSLSQLSKMGDSVELSDMFDQRGLTPEVGLYCNELGAKKSLWRRRPAQCWCRSVSTLTYAL